MLKGARHHFGLPLQSAAHGFGARLVVQPFNGKTRLLKEPQLVCQRERQVVQALFGRQGNRDPMGAARRIDGGHGR